ncbi:MAG: sirohydrochlorin cobaltochelatase [Clostridia bacterium]|nr:sirohydrochlorin cobaltochelatase [Clostridia bacterium]
MKKIFSLLLAITLGTSIVGCNQQQTEEPAEEASSEVKKAILVVSFGTSYADTREKTIGATEQRIGEAFPEYDIKRAFTSQFIINKLKERDGIEIDNPNQALTRLKEEGYTEVYVQSLHVINGAEYDELTEAVMSFTEEFNILKMGKPLLTGHEDYAAVANAYIGHMPERSAGEAVLLMGHGTHHDANAAYACLDYVFEDEGIDNVFVGTVEGFPELGTVIKKLEKNQIEKVTLMPLMVVAGDHAQNDMAGDEEDSWKVMLKSQGYDVDYILKGLGEMPEIQELYIEHLEAAINGE